MRYLNTLLLVLILIIAGGSAAYYYFNTNQLTFDQAQATPAQPVYEAPIFMALEPFTVTIQGNRNSRILYTEITLRLNEMDSHSRIAQYMPEVRNRILSELALQSSDELQTAEGRTALIQRLKEIISEPYYPHPNGPNISSVLFTAFVIQ